MNISIRERQPLVCGVRLFALLLLLVTGCGRGDQREPLQGTVSLDGQPLSHGRITFRPIQGTGGPTAGAEIANGQFAIASEKGTFAGMFRVEIMAWRKTGRTSWDPDEGQVVQSEQYIPRRYNEQSELRAEVTEAQPNRYEFALTTK